LVKIEDRTIFPDITNLLVPFKNQEDLLEDWQVSITERISKKGDKTHCNNYRGPSYLSFTYKFFFIILLPKLSPNAEELIGDT
jgi:hypothetical protein